VLFHQTKFSEALLQQMKVRETISILSTFSEMNRLSSEGFKRYVLFPGELSLDGLRPCLGRGDIQRFVTASDWWNEIVLGNDLSRKDVTLSAANQDGGAHVDPTPNEKTMFLKQGSGTLTTISSKGVFKKELLDSHLYLLRQFGYEILNSPALQNEVQG